MEESILRPQPLVILNKIELLSRSEKKSLYSIVKGIELLSHIRENNSDPLLLELGEYFSQANKNTQIWRDLGSIIIQDSLRELAFLCLKEEAFTYRTISKKINQTQPTLYRNMKILMELGIITPSLPLHTPHERGRSVVVYQTPDATPETIARVCETHKHLINPIFMQATNTAQQILDNYPIIQQKGETSYRDILDHMKQQGIKNHLQIAELVSRQLTQLGIKVWR